MLEGLPASAPRKGRKLALTLCERVEASLERSAEEKIRLQLAQCEETGLTTLAEKLLAVQMLLVGHSNGEKCVEAVRELLDVLDEFLFGVDGDSLLLPTMLVGAAAAAMAVAGVTGARGR